ncbi:MAG: insulinase family protein [Archangium sp.]|nr:insulinase family protein [Archangium sp.]
MKRLLPLMLMLGCATTPVATEPVVTRPNPGLEAVPQKRVLAELPAALDVDPKALTVAPLEVKVTRPERYELPNGLVVYLMEDHTSPLVLVRTLIPVGAVDEPADRLGVSGITAELVTAGGAGSRTPEQLDELLEFHAADLNGGAADEYSQVSLSVRSQDLAALFPVFADVLQRPRFDATRFEVTKSRVLESIKRRNDRPDGLAARALSKALYGTDSLLGRESSEATVKAITVDDVKKHHAKWTPRAARLVITGDFDRAAVKTLVERSFAAWKGAAPPARSFPTAGPPGRRVILVPRAVAQVKVRIGGAGWTRRSPDEYPMRLVNTALGSFGVGRLYREIRDERGLAYSASSSVGGGPTFGQFTASFDTRPQQAVQALEVALEVLTRTGRADSLTQAELATATDMALNTFAFRFDSVSRIAWERALSEFFGYDDDYLDRYRDRISQVTPAQVNAATAKLTKQDALQIVIVGPRDVLGDLSRFGPVTVVEDVDSFR